MSWAEFRKKQVVEVSLEKLDLPFKVTMRRMGSMTLGEIGKFQDKKPEEYTVEDQKDILTKLVVKWDVTDPDTEQPLPVDRTSMDKIPVAVMSALMEALNEKEKEALPQQLRS